MFSAPTSALASPDVGVFFLLLLVLYCALNQHINKLYTFL